MNPLKTHVWDVVIVLEQGVNGRTRFFVVHAFMFIFTDLIRAYYSHFHVHLSTHKRRHQHSQIKKLRLLAVRRLLQLQHIRLAHQVRPISIYRTPWKRHYRL